MIIFINLIDLLQKNILKDKFIVYIGLTVYNFFVKILNIYHYKQLHLEKNNFYFFINSFGN
jgi:hypothetical protein